MLHRMRELAVASQNGTNLQADRNAMQAEFEQLQWEIERIADNTQFNGQNVLDGTPGNYGRVSYQVGANTNQTISVGFGDFETKKTALVADAADVTNATNLITKSAHGLATGDAVLFTQASGTNMGLTTGGTYYVIWQSATTFNLAASYQNALAGTVQGLANDGADGQTVTKLSSYGGNIDSTTITISSAANAASALTVIDTAIAGVDSQRAKFGAGINRLNYAIDNLSQTKVNTEASRSRVLDTDYAAETSELARTQIIAQAGIAMLSQANMQPQNVLALLKG